VCDFTYTSLSSEKRRARKVHQCCECLRDIAVGELHKHWAGLVDGDFQASRAHLVCYELATAMSADGCFEAGYVATMHPDEVPEKWASEWWRVHGTKELGDERVSDGL
jgi:hypothetical protein